MPDLNWIRQVSSIYKTVCCSWSSAKVCCMDALAVKLGSGEWVGISQVKGKCEGGVGSGAGSGQKEETQKGESTMRFFCLEG